jgi:hypothetical protein
MKNYSLIINNLDNLSYSAIEIGVDRNTAESLKKLTLILLLLLCMDLTEKMVAFKVYWRF